MAAFMAKTYAQVSLLKRTLRDIIHKEQNINCFLRCYAIRKGSEGIKFQSSRLKAAKENFEKYVPLEKIKKKRPTIEVWQNMTVKELAVASNRTVEQVLLAIGSKCPEWTEISDCETLYAAVRRFGCNSKLILKLHKKVKQITNTDVVRSLPDESVLVRRHPVVTIMGHVDHGKTTLLDTLRNASIAKSEFGGITQHIGAFNVTLKSGEQVTFLDTPGHAAFSSMRHRGAHVTDIVVLVVAADDGVQDQTLQSIEMAQKANVPIIVAINKIDKHDANIDRTQQMLAEHDVVIEALGGPVQCVHISALKNINLSNLIEAIVIQAEIMCLKGDPVGLVEGVIIECSTHVGRGKLVTALIKRGTLKKGCLLVSGLAWAKVRGMFNDSGIPVLEAKPSDAVQIIGWKELPSVGDEILQVENDKILNSVLKYREAKHAEKLTLDQKESIDKQQKDHLTEYNKTRGLRQEFGWRNSVVKQILIKKRVDKAKALTDQVDNKVTVNVIIKGDVAGTVEAILNVFDSYTYDNLCLLNVVHYGIGTVTEGDLQLAETFDAIIYQFNVTAPKTIEVEANQKGISIRHFNVIYKLFENLRDEIISKLPPVDEEEILGEASVLKQFTISERKKKILVAGCYCSRGVLSKDAMYHLKRGDEIIHTGKLMSMKHLKNEVTSVNVSVECGLSFADPSVTFEPGDTIVCFKYCKVVPTLEWNFGF